MMNDDDDDEHYSSDDSPETTRLQLDRRPSISTEQLAAKSEDPSITQRRERLREKHQRLKKYAHQHNRDPQWFEHKKHILICSWSGRPIFTRYGDDQKMAAYMGVISAIISNFQAHNDTVRSIIAGKHKFVFLLKGPLYLIAITRTQESIAQLSQQLSFVHGQVLSMLTGSINTCLQTDPNFEVRNLMGGTEYLLADLISDSNCNPCYLLSSIECLKLPKSVRSKVGSVMRKCRSSSLLYAMLLADSKVVNLVQSKHHILGMQDILLLINFVTNSESLRSSESWAPICLPNFNDSGYLYAYVCYLDGDVCLTLVTNKADDFFQLKECKQQMVEGFENNGCMVAINEAVNAGTVSVADLDASIPEFWHFVYKNVSLSQSVHCRYMPPHQSKAAKKTLFQNYQRLHSRIGGSRTNKGHTIYYEVTKTMTLLGWLRPGDFEMYVVFSPLVTKESVTTACNRALRWIKREEDSLFILNPPTF